MPRAHRAAVVAVSVACLLCGARPAPAEPAPAASPSPAGTHPDRAVAPAEPVSPDKPGAAAAPAEALDKPSLSVLLLPLPFVAIAGVLGYENFAIGPTRHELHLVAGYDWSYSNRIFDPAKTLPTPLGEAQQADTYGGTAEWGWRIDPHWTLSLAGYVAGGDVALTPGYDQDLAQGLSASVGPRLTFADLDNHDWPTRGALARASYQPGYHWGAASESFQRGALELTRYMPMGTDATLAFHGLARLGTPHLPWVDKFDAGGGDFLRGYPSNRFTGDRQLTGTVEYRNLFWPNAIPWSVLENAGLAIGLAFEAYVDVGRVWESSQGIPFPADPHLGGGSGLILTINRSPVGRLELNGSSEGFYPVAAFATSF